MNTSFNGQVTGLGLADFMLGKLNEITFARPNPHYSNGTVVAVYAGDIWKATPILTLSYGLRWEPFIPQYSGAIYNFDEDRFRQGIKSTVFLNAPAGMYYPGNPGFPKNGVNAAWWHFAPRMGLAWNVSGDGRASVRASYTYTYVPPPGNYRLPYSGGPPWGGRTILSSPPGGLGGNPFPYDINKNAPFTPYGLYYTQPYDLPVPSSSSWNLNFQKQIGKDGLVSASYMGSNVIHTWPTKPLNFAIYFPGVADANGNRFAEGYVFKTTLPPHALHSAIRTCAGSSAC